MKNPNVKMCKKTISFLLSFSLIYQQLGFAQVAAQLNMAGYLSRMGAGAAADKFRPAHLRYFSYDPQHNNFNLLIDKGDLYKSQPTVGAPFIAPAKDSSLRGAIVGTGDEAISNNEILNQESKKLFDYFLIGLTLPNTSFWVNLRPDIQKPSSAIGAGAGLEPPLGGIIDSDLARTDIGRIMLEADVQLKKDTARWTSPENPQGKEYWERLYRKANEIFGNENVNIPTLTRPWIVPGEVIIRTSGESAYIYKATLKVMLEQDYLKDSSVYNFKDARMKVLNEYSSQLIRELIIPQLTKEVNTSKRYSALRQVYFSLILAQYFKTKYSNQRNNYYANIIDNKNLTGLTSKESWSKDTYFKEYQKSFQEGEYNIKQPVFSAFGQSIRSYFSGGIQLGSSPVAVVEAGAIGDNRFTQALTRAGMEAVRVDLDGKIVAIQEGPASSPAVPKKPKTIEDLVLISDPNRHIRKVYTAHGRSADVFGDWELKPISQAVQELGQRAEEFISLDNAGKIFTHLLDNLRFMPEEAYIEYGYFNRDVERDVVMPVFVPTLIRIANALLAKGIGMRLSEEQKAYAQGLAEKQNVTYGGFNAFAYEQVAGHRASNIDNTDYRTLGQALLQLDQLASKGTSSPASSPVEGKQETTVAAINEVVSSSPVAPKDTGGIDFRYINMVTQIQASSPAVMNFKMPDLNVLRGINVTEEASDLQKMMTAGILPSSQRMIEFMSACYLMGNTEKIADEVTICEVNFFRLQEEFVEETPQEFKAFLCVIEKSSPAA